MSSSPTRRRGARRVVAGLVAVVGLLAVAPSAPAGALSCGDVGDPRIDFVCDTYAAMAGRTPSSSELDHWVPRVPAQRASLVTALGRSTPGRRLVVRAYYSRFRGFQPSDGDLAYWVPRVTEPKGLRTLEAALVAAGPADIDFWVANAYAKQLGRSPSPTERTYWGDRANLTSRNKVAAEISNTSEARRARVRGAYLNDLGSLPSESDRAYWAERLRTGTSYLDVRIGIRSSAAAYPNASGCTAAAAPQTAEQCVG